MAIVVIRLKKKKNKRLRMLGPFALLREFIAV